MSVDQPPDESISTGAEGPADELPDFQIILEDEDEGEIRPRRTVSQVRPISADYEPRRLRSGPREQIDDARHLSSTMLLALVFLAAAEFAIARHISPAQFAFVTGTLALLGGMLLSSIRHPTYVSRIAWWLLVAIYGVGTLRAIAVALTD